MSIALVLAALVGMVVLGVVAELYERRAERRARNAERATKRRRLLDEIRGHE